MRSIALLTTITCALLAGAASAELQEQPAMTAGDLQQLCLGSDHVSRNACRIYILGVTQGVEVGLAIADGKLQGGRPCVPADISAETLESTLKSSLAQSLAASAANRNRDAARFIGSVLTHTFPCQKGRR